MQWTVLNPVQIECFFSKELTDEANALNERIAGLLKRRVDLDQSSAAQKATNVLNFDFVQVILVPQDQLEKVQVLQQELQIRADLDAFAERRHRERCQAADQAFDQCQKAAETVRKKLTCMGYHEQSDCVPDPCSILPLFIQRHPTVHQAMNEHQALQSQCNSRDFRNENLAAAQRVEAELNAIRDRVLPID